MAVIKNKEVLQSYIVTTARYDFTIYEKRILYRIIEVLQSRINGLKLNYNYSIQPDMYGDFEFTLPISCFLKDENDKNYTEVKKALRSLRNKDFEYEDASEWGVYGIIEKPKIKKYDSVVKLVITPLLLEAFTNFAKGYRKYELKTAMQFESIYSMRFYELLSGQIQPITYTIDQLKKMFKLEGKYKRTNDFFRKVIEPAKTELDAKSPYSFDFKVNKHGRMYHSITFYPVHKSENDDNEILENQLTKKTSIYWDLPREVVKYFKEIFAFTDDEIKQHLAMFKDAYAIFDLVGFVSEKKRYSEGKNNPKGYVISCIKNKLEEELKKLTI